MPVIIKSIIIFLTVLWCYWDMLLKYFIFKHSLCYIFQRLKKQFSEKRLNRRNSAFFFTIFCNKCCFFWLALVFDKNLVYRFKDIIIENIFLKNFVILFSGTHSLKKKPVGQLFWHCTVSYKKLWFPETLQTHKFRICIKNLKKKISCFLKHTVIIINFINRKKNIRF